MANATQSSNMNQQPQVHDDGLLLKNDLANSSSRYLRLHSSNPVAWQQFTPATLNLARNSNRLIFLSIGYSACHWCHVMERESFSSPDVAELLNKHFIPIKVDREERPDLDDIYMNFVTATTGSGGWPLNVFLTPELKPVFGGTYWPTSGGSAKHRTQGGGDEEIEVLSFFEVLEKMEDVWRNERERCLVSAGDITKQLSAFAAEGIHGSNQVRVQGEDEDHETPEELELDLIDDALDQFVARYDSQHGGFGSVVASATTGDNDQTPCSTVGVGPKFPTAVNLTFLLRIGASIMRPSTHTRFGFPNPLPAILGRQSCTSAASMAVHTLLTISRSALRDHLGHGFHRYSVTQDWNLPHFEKMTVDNALLLGAYCDAWALGRNPEVLGTIYDLVKYFTDEGESYIIRKQGGWYSSEDAESTLSKNATGQHHDEAKEGAFYVWTLKELQTILGEKDASILARHFGIKEHGNIPREHDVNDELVNQNVLFVDATPSVLAKEFGLKEEEVVRIIKEGKKKLIQHRTQTRGRPTVDDKIVVSYNGLVIAALARAANTLMEIDLDRTKKCQDAAVKAVEFIRKQMFDEKTGKLTRVCSDQSALPQQKGTAFVDDYAFMIQGLIKLYDLTFEKQYLDFAFRLQETLDRDFYVSRGGGYFQASRSSGTTDTGLISPPTSPPAQGESQSNQSATQRLPEQIINLKPGTDNALPSANGVIAQNLLYLAAYSSALTPENTKHAAELRHKAKKTIDTFAPEIIQHPFIYVSFLTAIVLDQIGVKPLLVPASMTDAEIETEHVRGFGRAVVKVENGKAGEILICTNDGVCRPLKEGELVEIDDGFGEEDGNTGETEKVVDAKTIERREAQARMEDEVRKGSPELKAKEERPVIRDIPPGQEKL